MEELRGAARGLLWMSESDYPFDIVRWENMPQVAPEFLRHIAGQSATSPVELQDIDDFFRAAITEYEGQGEEARKMVAGYRKLAQALKANLTERSVFRVGQTNIKVYVVGRAPSGNWLGITTRVVET